jgi:hypothetical protein
MGPQKTLYRRLALDGTLLLTRERKRECRTGPISHGSTFAGLAYMAKLETILSLPAIAPFETKPNQAIARHERTAFANVPSSAIALIPAAPAAGSLG